VLIDWFTVAAQALNFLVLVWLLQRLLYRPILAALEAREKLIANELANADTRRTEAQKQRDDLLQKNVEFERQRTAMIAQATDQANAEHQRLLSQAQLADDAASVKRQQAIRSESQALGQAIRDRTQREVLAIARKALTDLSTVTLEASMVAVFLQRMRAMDVAKRGALAGAFKDAADTALLRSAFDLTDSQHASIQNIIHEVLSPHIRLRFQTAPELIGGIELSGNGQQVSWNIADYLTSFEGSLAQLQKEQNRRAG
jgi:F-type H+-transporting ATPase subunit b